MRICPPASRAPGLTILPTFNLGCGIAGLDTKPRPELSSWCIIQGRMLTHDPGRRVQRARPRLMCVAWSLPVCALLLVALNSSSSLADTIYLKNGHQITGKVSYEDAKQVAYEIEG